MISRGGGAGSWAVGVLAVLALTGGSGPTPVMTSEDGAAVVADAGASPEQVVTASVAALQERDVDDAHALVTGSGRQVADTWLGDTPEIDRVRVSPSVPDSTTGSATEGFQTAVCVPVQLTLHGGDGSLPDGPDGWGSLLARNADTDPWRIVDNGVG